MKKRDYSELYKRAIEQGKLSRIKKLLKKTKNHSQEILLELGYLDFTPLDLSIYKQKTKIALCLIKDGRFDPSNSENYSIRKAALNGYFEVVKELLKDKRVDASAKSNSVIVNACSNGHLSIVKLLMCNKGVDPGDGNNLAVRKAAKRGHVKVVRLLVKDKRVDASDMSNEALREASRWGHYEVVKELIKDKRVNPVDENNASVRFALLNGHKEIVKELLNDERVDAEEIINWAFDNNDIEVIRLLLTFDKICYHLDLFLLMKNNELMKEVINDEEFIKTSSIIFQKKLEFENHKIKYQGNIFDEKGTGHLYKMKLTIRGRSKIPIYSGHFKRGMKNGIGRLFYPNSNQIEYYGEFKCDKKHGIGRSFSKDGVTIQKGQWKDDHYEKEIMCNLDDVKEIRQDTLDWFMSLSFGETQKLILGKGSFGIVYKFDLKHPLPEGRYAFKHFDGLNVNKLSKEDLDRIKHEISLLAGVYHRNIIKIIGVSWKTPIGLLTELCDTSIYDLIVKREVNEIEEIPFSDKILYLFETCQGLEYLHLNHIIHRDMKWQNVLLKYDKSVKTIKIIDFGLSTVNESFRESLQLSVVGTPEYFAPEVGSQKYTYSADVFSFGIMMYQLLFETSDVYDRIKNPSYQGKYLISLIKKGLRPFINTDDEIVMEHPELITLMKRCWDKNPSKRPTFTQIINNLLPYYDKYVLHRTEQSLSDNSQKGNKKKRILTRAISQYDILKIEDSNKILFKLKSKLEDLKDPEISVLFGKFLQSDINKFNELKKLKKEFEQLKKENEKLKKINVENEDLIRKYRRFI